MKILVVSENYWPDTFAVNDLTAKLAERGHEVTVLTGLPDYTTSRIPEEYQHGKNRHQTYKGVTVRRVPTIARRHGPVWRSLNYLSFWFNGRWAANKEKWEDFDVIYVWEVSPVTMAFPAIALKKRFGKKVLLHCLDIWPECVKAMGLKEGTLPYRMITRISRKAYGGCDQIAVSSLPFIDYLHEVDGVPKEKMTYLPQYGPSDMLEKDFRKVSAGDRTDFLYIGNLGKAQGLEVLFQAVKHIQTSRPYHFHIVGGGSEEEACRDLVRRLGLEQVVTFYGPMPFDKAQEQYKRADACVFTLKGDTHIGDTLPGKIQTYMAAGKPILASCNGAGRQVIEESGGGRCVPAGDVLGYARILTDFIDHREAYEHCGQDGQAYFKSHFTQEKFFAKLEEMLQELSKQ